MGRIKDFHSLQRIVEVPAVSKHITTLYFRDRLGVGFRRAGGDELCHRVLLFRQLKRSN